MEKEPSGQRRESFRIIHVGHRHSAGLEGQHKNSSGLFSVRIFNLTLLGATEAVDHIDAETKLTDPHINVN